MSKSSPHFKQIKSSSSHGKKQHIIDLDSSSSHRSSLCKSIHSPIRRPINKTLSRSNSKIKWKLGKNGTKPKCQDHLLERTKTTSRHKTSTSSPVLSKNYEPISKSANLICEAWLSAKFKLSVILTWSKITLNEELKILLEDLYCSTYIHAEHLLQLESVPLTILSSDLDYIKKLSCGFHEHNLEEENRSGLMHFIRLGRYASKSVVKFIHYFFEVFVNTIEGENTYEHGTIEYLHEMLETAEMKSEVLKYLPNVVLEAEHLPWLLMWLDFLYFESNSHVHEETVECIKKIEQEQIIDLVTTLMEEFAEAVDLVWSYASKEHELKRVTMQMISYAFVSATQFVQTPYIDDFITEKEYELEKNKIKDIKKHFVNPIDSKIHKHFSKAIELMNEHKMLVKQGNIHKTYIAGSRSEKIVAPSNALPNSLKSDRHECSSNPVIALDVEDKNLRETQAVPLESSLPCISSKLVVTKIESETEKNTPDSTSFKLPPIANSDTTLQSIAETYENQEGSSDMKRVPIEKEEIAWANHVINPPCQRKQGVSVNVYAPDNAFILSETCMETLLRPDSPMSDVVSLHASTSLDESKDSNSICMMPESPTISRGYNTSIAGKQISENYFMEKPRPINSNLLTFVSKRYTDFAVKRIIRSRETPAALRELSELKTIQRDEPAPSSSTLLPRLHTPDLLYTRWKYETQKSDGCSSMSL